MASEETYGAFEESSKSMAAPLIISFLAGGVIGSLITYYVTRNKMREEKEKEITDVTSYYENLGKGEQSTFSVSFDGIKEDHPRDDLPPEEKPYPISQKEYVEDMDYHKETVVYYEKDDILTDMFDREILIEDTIGKEALEHFDEDEEDTAYSRNEKNATDYEIIKEHKSFAAVMGENEVN